MLCSTAALGRWGGCCWVYDHRGPGWLLLLHATTRPAMQHQLLRAAGPAPSLPSQSMGHVYHSFIQKYCWLLLLVVIIVLLAACCLPSCFLQRAWQTSMVYLALHNHVIMLASIKLCYTFVYGVSQPSAPIIASVALYVLGCCGCPGAAHALSCPLLHSPTSDTVTQLCPCSPLSLSSCCWHTSLFLTVLLAR